MTNVHRLYEEVEKRIKADAKARTNHTDKILARLDHMAARLEMKARIERESRDEADMEAAISVLRWCMILGVAAILIFVAWQAKSKAAADLRMYHILEAIE